MLSLFARSELALKFSIFGLRSALSPWKWFRMIVLRCGASSKASLKVALVGKVALKSGLRLIMFTDVTFPFGGLAVGHLRQPERRKSGHVSSAFRKDEGESITYTPAEKCGMSLRNAR